ncbi:hypothetical protein GCM10027055_17440 [Janibacter alkaliphilus]|uniref:Transglycosylase SLT domain-containing protein n=1 Tax=Janibacter alkaliphilus TaxID=1069963 RepID=A0A852WYB3_9MICO|nr:hypothetical protein [Janibacter alkaliphilus]NYG35806.1 hypothetical protein [Janibacter alkaliphilus]
MARTTYQSRHGGSARTGRAQRAGALIRRPVVGSALAVGMLATVGATVATGEPSHEGETPLAAVSPTPSAPVEAVVAPADTERLSSDRREVNASRSESREKDRLAAARAAKAAKERKEAREKAAAEAREQAETLPGGGSAEGQSLAESYAEQAKDPEWVEAVQKDPKPYAVELMREAGFEDDQWGCLQSLWTGESDWTWDAENASSGAYGIPQSLPADKMATTGKDWKTNPITQMQWGITYIKDAYGSPCEAWEFWNKQDPHWY